MRSQARASLGESIQAMREHSSQLLSRPENAPWCTVAAQGGGGGGRIQNMKHLSEGNLLAVLVKLRGSWPPSLLPVPSFKNAFSPRPSPVVQLHSHRECHSHWLRAGIPLTCAVHSLYSCTWQPGSCTSKSHSSFQVKFKCFCLPEASPNPFSEAVSVLGHLSFL